MPAVRHAPCVTAVGALSTAINRNGSIHRHIHSEILNGISYGHFTFQDDVSNAATVTGHVLSTFHFVSSTQNG